MIRGRKYTKSTENAEGIWTEEPLSEKISENAPLTHTEEEANLKSQEKKPVQISNTPVEEPSSLIKTHTATHLDKKETESKEGVKEMNDPQKNFEKVTPVPKIESNTETNLAYNEQSEVKEDSMIKIMRGLKKENEELSKKLKETSNFSEHLLEVYNKKENDYIQEKTIMREAMEDIVQKASRLELSKNEAQYQYNKLKQEFTELNTKYAKEISQREKTLKKVEKYKSLIDKNLPNKIYSFRTLLKFILKYSLIIMVQIFSRKMVLKWFPKTKPFMRYLFFFIIFDFIKMFYI